MRIDLVCGLPDLPHCVDCADESAVALAADDTRRLYELLASLYCLGVPIQWTELFAADMLSDSHAHVAPLLPTYPFQRERCWLPDLTSL